MGVGFCRRQKDHPHIKKHGCHDIMRSIHNCNRSWPINNPGIHLHHNERSGIDYTPQLKDIIHIAFSAIGSAYSRSRINSLRQLPAIICSNGRNSIHIPCPAIFLAGRRQRQRSGMAGLEKNLVVSGIITFMPADDRSTCVLIFQFLS